MNIYSLLDDSTISSDLHANDKEELIHKLVDLLSHKIADHQIEGVREAVFKREEIMSTGVGKSLAIPHGKCASLDDNYACFARLSEPVEFNSIDNEPVKLAFLLVGPDSKNSAHIKLLSRISRIMNSATFRERLDACSNEQELYNAFKEEETTYFGS
ncbi:MAG: PTS sugar transporter subunit IIA [Balneolaceae bacterium]